MALGAGLECQGQGVYQQFFAGGDEAGGVAVPGRGGGGGADGEGDVRNAAVVEACRRWEDCGGGGDGEGGG